MQPAGKYPLLDCNLHQCVWIRPTDWMATEHSPAQVHNSSLGLGWKRPSGLAAKRPGVQLRRGVSRALAVKSYAMVNVDFASPSLVLGAVLIGAGILLLQASGGGMQCRDHAQAHPSMVSLSCCALCFPPAQLPSVTSMLTLPPQCNPLQMRNLQTRVSRDADIVVAAMISIVGSTLIFQGWRLDPLLLLCQVSLDPVSLCSSVCEQVVAKEAHVHCMQAPVVQVHLEAHGQ